MVKQSTLKCNYFFCTAGTSAGSRQEYTANSGRIRMKYEFSLEFKTLSEDGIMFYVADAHNIDFIALYIKGGQVGDSAAKM
jgi:hypothetical protein